MDNIDCCSKYKECSDAGHCLQASYSCTYKKNLEKGIVFYGKNKGNLIQPETDLYINKKSKDWYSYKTNDEEKKLVLEQLRSVGVDTIPKAAGACTSRVLLTKDDATYVIYQKDCRLMPRDAASEIVKKLGSSARVEMMGVEKHIYQQQILNKEEKKMSEELTFMVGIPKTKKLEIGLGQREKEHLKQVYCKTFGDFKKMLDWLNQSERTIEEKEKFWPAVENMIDTTYSLRQLISQSGVDPKEIIQAL